MDIKQFKDSLVDIETSALELSIGNFEEDKFESDCLHIAQVARELFVKIQEKE
tara:strand:+ start:166 stop:324 length:159 start_codon:yes stop_codon:yes gene_type:complete